MFILSLAGQFPAGAKGDDYLSNAWTGGWANKEVLNQTHSIPRRDTCPPTSSGPGPAKIPQIDFRNSAAKGTNSDGDRPPSDAPTITTGQGLAMVAQAMEQTSRNSSSNKNLIIKTDNILKYGT